MIEVRRGYLDVLTRRKAREMLIVNEVGLVVIAEIQRKV